MIKEKIVNILMPQSLIERVLIGDYPIQLQIILLLMDFSRILRYYFSYKGAFTGINNRENITKYNISAESFISENKKDGFSAYARLKNASDFIIPTVESAIDYFDEFILVENGSTDDTIKKCNYLQKKYPDKIKLYIYEPEVYPLFSKEFSQCPEDSIHSFAYMSNYTLSKVNYKYALKIDDDQIIIKENIHKAITKIKQNGLNNFLLTPLINVQKIKNKLLYSSDNYRSAFAGLFGDIGFHPVSPRIYFHSNTYTEGYVHNLFSITGPLMFIHLKLLKPGNGFKNYDSNGHIYLKKNYHSQSFKKINDSYKKLLHSYGISGE